MTQDVLAGSLLYSCYPCLCFIGLQYSSWPSLFLSQMFRMVVCSAHGCCKCFTIWCAAMDVVLSVMKSSCFWTCGTRSLVTCKVLLSTHIKQANLFHVCSIWSMCAVCGSFVAHWKKNMTLQLCSIVSYFDCQSIYVVCLVILIFPRPWQSDVFCSLSQHHVWF